MSDSCVILTANEIQKRYQGKVILEKINLQVLKGEAVFLVGSNGCGKSTLIRILAGLTHADSGVITYDKAVTMAMIPDRFEKNNMSVERFLHHMVALDEQSCSFDECLSYVKEYKMEGMLHTPMKYLSKGSLQKVAVIQALISRRNLIFMDEPLSGQDMISQMKLVKELRERKQQGVSFVAACHEKYLMEELADHIYEIRDGKIIDGSEYVYGKRMKKGMFLLRGVEAKTVRHAFSVKEKPQNMLISEYGTSVKIEVDISYVKEIFSYCIQNDITIVRYEEAESLC